MIWSSCAPALTGMAPLEPASSASRDGKAHTAEAGACSACSLGKHCPPAMTRRMAASRISTEAVFIRHPYTLAPGRPCTGMGKGMTSVKSRIRLGVSTR
ncbi:hypothetical protein D3C75_1148560 [compost metagenome]